MFRIVQFQLGHTDVHASHWIWESGNLKMAYYKAESTVIIWIVQLRTICGSMTWSEWLSGSIKLIKNTLESLFRHTVNSILKSFWVKKKIFFYDLKCNILVYLSGDCSLQMLNKTFGVSSYIIFHYCFF